MTSHPFRRLVLWTTATATIIVGVLLAVFASTVIATAAPSARHVYGEFRSRDHLYRARRACADIIDAVDWHVQLPPQYSTEAVSATIFALESSAQLCAAELRQRNIAPIGGTFEREVPMHRKVDHHVLAAVSPGDLTDAMTPRGFVSQQSSQELTRLRRAVHLLLVVGCESHRTTVDASQLRVDILSIIDVHGEAASYTVPFDLFSNGRVTHPDTRCRNSAAHVSMPIEILSGATRVSPRVVASIAALPHVRWVEAAPRFSALNRVATKTLQAESQFVDRPLWGHNLTGAGQIVAVGDTGVDWDSCFFDDPDQQVAIWPSVNRKHRKIISYVPCHDAETGARDVSDAEGGHGTHVTGSVAGNAQHNAHSHESVAQVSERGQYDGMAKDAQVFFYDLTCGSSVAHQDMIPPGDLYDFFEPGYAAGARVSSNSWGDGGAPKTYTAVLRRTDQFAFDNPDHVIVFAAGNSPTAGVISPAAGKSILTVGAHPNSEQESNRDLVCSFSARGATFDQRIKPDLLAPGQSIVSARSDGSHDTHQCITMSLFGTSMACPLVAGSAAIVRQYFEEGFLSGTGRPNPSAKMTPLSSTVRAMLIHSAQLIHITEQGPNALEGWGRIRPGEVLFLNTTGRRNHMFVDEHRRGLQHRETATWCVGVQQSMTEPLTVTIVWTDPALAAEGSARSVVNDLDLTVTNTGYGETYRGNAGTDHDHDNVVEKVVRRNAPSGLYSVTVYGYHVEPELGHDTPRYQGYARHYNGSQPFSIVMSGAAIDVTPGNCAQRYAVHPPPVPNPQTPQCPTGEGLPCSGNGQCTAKGVCVCLPGYHHVDCSVCDAELVCHGNGRCAKTTTGDLKCTCDAAFDVAKAADCSVCVAGRYGPHCDGDCLCNHGGCNRTAGTCTCDSSKAAGFWDGAKCDRCQFDYIRTPVDVAGNPVKPTPTSCTVAATWCTNREVRRVTVQQGQFQYIIINDNPTYDNSMSCGWIAKAASPRHALHLAFTVFDVEKPYDYVDIFRGEEVKTDALLAQATGTDAPSPLRVAPGESILIRFTSDYLGNNFKGLTAVLWTDACVDVQCHGNGACSPDKTKSDCICNEGFDPATDCETRTTASPSTGAPPTSTVAPTVSTAPTTKLASPAPQQITTVPSTTCQCSGHGVCTAAATCVCDAPYGGPTCAVTCPLGPSATHPDGAVCSGRGQCTADATCHCDAPTRGVACQVDPTSSLTVLTPATPSQRIVAATNASGAWRYVRYTAAASFPLPFPDRQVLRVRFGVEWPATAHGVNNGTADDSRVPQWTFAVWSSEDRAGMTERAAYLVTASRAEVAAAPLWTVDVLGFNHDAGLSSVLGVRRLTNDGHGAGPMVTALMEAIETPTGDAATCALGDTICRVDVAKSTAAPLLSPSAATALPSTTVPSNATSQEQQAGRYHIFRDPSALLYVLSGLAIAAVVGYALSALRRRRVRYAELEGGDDGADGGGVAAAPVDFEMEGHVVPRVVSGHAQRPRESDVEDDSDAEDLELHPAVRAAAAARGAQSSA